jgi:hypothetical protein
MTEDKEEDEAEMLAYMDEDEPEASYPHVQQAHGTVVVDISDEKD